MPDAVDNVLAQAGLQLPKQPEQQAQPPQGGLGSVGWNSGDNEIQQAARRVGDPANPIEDAWGLVKGLGEGVSHVAQGYYNLFTDPKARQDWSDGMNLLIHKPGMLGATTGHLWNGLKEDTASHWTDPEGNFDLGYTLWHHPASALFDLAMVKDAVAGGAKLYGRMGGGFSRAGLAPDVIEKIGKITPMTTADRMIAFGERLDRVPLDPLSLTGKMIGKTPPAKWLKEELGFGPAGEHLPYDARVAQEQGAVNAELAQKQKLLLEAKLGPGSGDRVLDAIDRGSTQDYAALLPREKDFVDRYKATQGLIGHPTQTLALPERETMLKERGYIPGDTTSILAKQGAVREWGEGALNDQRLEEAVAKIKSGEWNPTYRFMAHEKGHEYSMLENLMADARSERLASATGQGVGAQLKTRTGMGVYEKDPLQATFRQVGMEAQMDKRIRMKDAILDLAHQRGELKVVRSEADIPSGWKVIPTEAWERAMVQEKRAAGLAWAQEAKGLDKGGAAREAYAQLMRDPKTLEAISNNKILAAPNWLSNYMRFRLAIPSPLARTYDNLFRYWKSWATILRPSYWMNVVAGNGFLAALHGVSPMDAVRFWSNRKFLPAELQAIAQLPRPGAGVYQRAVAKGRTVDSLVHTYLDKGPAFAKGVEGLREQAQRLAQAGHKFDASAEVLADPDKWYRMVAQAPEQLSQAVRNHTVLREQLASQVPHIQAKEAEYQKAMGDYQKIIDNVKQQPKAFAKYMHTLPEAEGNALRLEGEVKGLKEENLQALAKEGMVRQRMPQMQEMADWAERAIGPANELQGSYLRLHPLERTWLSRAIPFYPWIKAMSALAFRLPFLYPKQTFLWNRYNATMNDLMSKDEFVPSWLRGAVHVGLVHDPEQGAAHVFVRPFWDPFRSAEPIKWGGVTLPGIAGGLLRHPLLKVAFDGMGGVDSFTMKPWSTDENMVRSDNGEVYKLDPKTGHFERTIAQPDIWRRLWGLLPESQMVDQLLMPHIQTDRGWIGHQDPVRDRFGEPMPPVPWLQRAAKSLLPVSFQTEDQQAHEEVRQARLYKAYIKEIRHMEPDKQQAAAQVLDDAFGPKKK